MSRNMTRYELDDYVDHEYSSDSINVSCVCSWKIRSFPDGGLQIYVEAGEYIYTEDSWGVRDNPVRQAQFAAKLRRAEAGLA